MDQVSSMINVLTGITDNNGVKESLTSADALGAGDRKRQYLHTRYATFYHKEGLLFKYIRIRITL